MRRRTPGLKELLIAGVLLAGSLTVARAQRGGWYFKPPTFTPVYPTRRDTEQQIGRLKLLADKKAWDKWLQLYEQLVEERGRMVARGPKLLVSLRDVAHEKFAALPPAVKQRYQTLYAGEARKLYETADREDDPGQMAEVWGRFRHTAYGPKALTWLGNRALDRGQWDMAVLAYTRAAATPEASATLMLRCAMAAKSAGKPDQAKIALQRLRTEFGAAQVRYAGAASTGAAAADAYQKTLDEPARETAESPWSGFQGGDGTRRMGPFTGASMKPLWQHKLTVSENFHFDSSAQYDRAYLSGGFQFLAFPAIDGARLWVQGPMRLAGLNLDTGQADFDHLNCFLPGSDIARMDEEPRWRGGWRYRFPYGRAVQTAPAIRDHRLVVRVPLAAYEAQPDLWPVDFAMAAYDTRSGKELWRRAAGGNPRGMFYNNPTLGAGVVLTGVATHKGGTTEYQAVALEAGTGEPLWETYLGGGSQPLGLLDGSPALVRDGEVWIETSLHTLAALDLLTGEPRLMCLTDFYKRHVAEAESEEGPMVDWPITLIAARKDRILFAPRWGSDLICIDPATGKRLWQAPKEIDFSRTWDAVMFAVDDQRAYLCGHNVQAINLDTGKPAWLWTPAEYTSNVGHAALAGDRIYFPIRGKLQTISASDGKALDLIDLGDALGGTTSFPSILASNGRLYLCTHDRVVAFGPK